MNIGKRILLINFKAKKSKRISMTNVLNLIFFAFATKWFYLEYWIAFRKDILSRQQTYGLRTLANIVDVLAWLSFSMSYCWNLTFRFLQNRWTKGSRSSNFSQIIHVLDLHLKGHKFGISMFVVTPKFLDQKFELHLLDYKWSFSQITK